MRDQHHSLSNLSPLRATAALNGVGSFCIIDTSANDALGAKGPASSLQALSLQQEVLKHNMRRPLAPSIWCAAFFRFFLSFAGL